MKRCKLKISVLLVCFCLLIIFLFYKYRFLLIPFEVDYKLNDFPSCLVPISMAEEIRYSSPSCCRIMPGVYKISYKVKIAYPAESVIKEISENLRRQGFIKPKLTVFPYGGGRYDVWQEDPEIIKDRPRLATYSEEWLTVKNDSMIHVSYAYTLPLDKGDNRNNLFVNESLYTEDSWQYPHVVNYKQFNPEEFAGQQQATPAK